MNCRRLIQCMKCRRLLRSMNCQDVGLWTGDIIMKCRARSLNLRCAILRLQGVLSTRTSSSELITICASHTHITISYLKYAVSQSYIVSQHRTWSCPTFCLGLAGPTSCAPSVLFRRDPPHILIRTPRASVKRSSSAFITPWTAFMHPEFEICFKTCVGVTGKLCFRCQW